MKYDNVQGIAAPDGKAFYPKSGVVANWNSFSAYAERPLAYSVQ
jgi:hypothetical protein